MTTPAKFGKLANATGRAIPRHSRLRLLQSTEFAPWLYSSRPFRKAQSEVTAYRRCYHCGHVVRRPTPAAPRRRDSSPPSSQGYGHTSADSGKPSSPEDVSSTAIPEPDQLPQTSSLSETVRHMMRHVAHPVAVITATDVSVSPQGSPEAWRGATVSSFNTVTLNPVPVVSLNIKKPSSTLDAIQNSGFFNVHLLSSAIPGVEAIAAKFANGKDRLPFHDHRGELEPFAARDLATRSPAHPPVLQMQTEEGHHMVPLRFHCQYLPDKSVDVGDHVVVFGVVTGHFYGDVALPTHATQVCLIYANGSYHRTEPQPSDEGVGWSRPRVE